MKNRKSIAMNKKRNVKRSILTAVTLVGAFTLVGLAFLAWQFTSGLRTPARVPAPDYWPTEGWRTSTPEEQGFDSVRLAKGLQSLLDKQVNIDSLLIVRNGYVVLDAHFDPYNGTFPHDLASVTKSVMTTLIAIAAEQGRLDLDQPVVSYFPGRRIANLDERKARLTVRHLAGMVNGMESGCYDGDMPTLQKIRANADWVQAALDRPMVSEPGKEFCYDSPGMHLLSAILQEATGMTALDFARKNLFAPLGIQNVIWETDPQGYMRGWGDLHLLPGDLAKIGYLWLHRGNWNGQQIVSEAWVLDSVKAHSKFIKPDFGYGYGWWVTWGDYQAAGRGGQKVRVMASKNTIVAATGGNYDSAEVESWLVPALIQLKDKRPPNPEGLKMLDSVLRAAEQGASAWTTSSILETVKENSGKPYRCDTNPAGIETVRYEFDGSNQIDLLLKLGGAEYFMPIGLDGIYRLASDGTGSRGYWEDAQTFQFEAFDIGQISRTLVFDGDSLQISLPEANLTVACQVQGN